MIIIVTIIVILLYYNIIIIIITVSVLNWFVSVLKVGLWSLSRELCKTGCPVGQRRELWSHALSVDFTKPEVWFHMFLNTKCNHH